MAVISVQDPHASSECQVCQRPLSAAHVKTLYGVPVCRKCRNGFANRRQAAYLVDAALWWLMVMSVFLVLQSLLLGPSLMSRGAQRVRLAPSDSVITVLMIWSLMSIWVLPFVFATLKDGFQGRSPGKFLFGLQVVDAESREPIGFGQAFKRNLILVIPYLNLIGLVGGVITMMGGRRWGERWAHTEVIWLKHKTKLPFCPDDRYCRGCGYDLMGNQSGYCPECGRSIPVPAKTRVYCLSCTCELTDVSTGWCPSCGREIHATVPAVLPDDERSA